MRRPTTHLLLVLLAFVAPPCLGQDAAENGRLEVRWVSPTPSDVLEGTTVLEVAVIPHGSVTTFKVDFYVENQRIGWRDDPPYRIEWNAGKSLSSRQIRAVAYASNGQTYEASVTTQEIRIDYRAEVSVVNVFATVRDYAGSYVGGLEVEKFRLFEDGVEQRLTHFAYENLPLHVAFVLDVSLTMRGERLATAREAAERFAQSLDFSRDQAMVVTFAGKPREIMPLSDSKDAILAAVRSAKEEPGGTALYDGLLLAVNALRPIDGRKAVILLTDGRDESGDGFRPGSFHTFEESLQQAHQSDVIVYTIGLGKNIAQQLDFHGVRTVGELLSRMAAETGGTSYLATRPRQLRRAYDTVATALRHQYNLGYSSTNSRRDGTWREIRVLSTLEDAQVTARKGYYAPTE
jgi:Ca-activated chloride channel family protein